MRCEVKMSVSDWEQLLYQEDDIIFFDVLSEPKKSIIEDKGDNQ